MAGFGRVADRVTGIYIYVYAGYSVTIRGVGGWEYFDVYDSANLQVYTVMNRGMSSTLC